LKHPFVIHRDAYQQRDQMKNDNGHRSKRWPFSFGLYASRLANRLASRSAIAAAWRGVI
jgi:hypothetical protein